MFGLVIIGFGMFMFGALMLGAAISPGSIAQDKHESNIANNSKLANLILLTSTIGKQFCNYSALPTKSLRTEMEFFLIPIHYNAYMIIINILNFWSIIAHYDSWSIGRKIGF
jgi:hypothetical protein